MSFHFVYRISQRLSALAIHVFKPCKHCHIRQCLQVVASTCHLVVSGYKHIARFPTEQPRRSAVHAHDFYMDHLAPNAKWKNMMLVCSHIREIAILTPQLWTHVDLSWPSERISMVLSRAGTLPLTFRAWNVYRGRRRTLQDVNLAAACFRRVYAASIDFMDDSGMQEIALITNQPATDLVSLYVGLQNDQEHSFTTSLKHYPALVHLTLDSGGLGERIEARMPCLTRFRIDSGR
jgi:hypothetical protein